MARSIDDVLEYEGRCSIMEFELDVIQRISDIEYQRKVWIEHSLPNVIDSCEDMINDFDIDDFLKDLTPESNPEFGLSAHQIEQLWKLRNIINDYSDATPKHMNSHEVLSDPRWHKVVDCAKETMKAFEGYKVPTDDML